MKKIISLAIIVLIIIAIIALIPKLIHKCNDCGKTFFGAGYEPNAFVDILSAEEQVICKECAEKQHAIEIGLGKSVEEFKRDLF